MEVMIHPKLYKSIKEYCELNELNIEDFINETLKTGFNVAKYGDRPLINTRDVVVPQETTDNAVAEEEQPKKKNIYNE